MAVPILVPANKLPVVERAIARALRPIKGSGIAEVKDGPTGVIIHVPERKPPTSGGGAPRVTVTARLTARDPTQLHIASWEEVDVAVGGAATTRENGFTGTFTDEPAIETNLNPLALVFPDPIEGDILTLTRDINSDGEIVWTWGAGYDMPFEVFVLQDGGVAGDEFTNCTFTYEVRTFDNFIVGTFKTPLRPRLPLTTYFEAPDFSIAYAAWFGPLGGGAISLDFVLEEIEDTSVCNIP